MRKLMLAYVDSFPAPVHEGSTALWHLAPVLQVLDVSHIAMQINLAKEAGRLESPLHRDVRTLVA